MRRTIVYEVKKESGVCDAWILEHVVPNIAKKYHKNVALHFGRALLWRIMDPDSFDFVPRIIVKRVQHQYSLIVNKTLDTNENPVAKTLLLLTRCEGNLIMTKIDRGR